MTIVTDKTGTQVVPFPAKAVNPFVPGDVVRLKSGGPKMTVCTIQGGSVDVRWFDRDGMNETRVVGDAIYHVEKRTHGAPV